MRNLIGFILAGFSATTFAGDDLTYELSFGNHLELSRSGQEVSITARNDTNEEIRCGDFLLSDEGVSDLPRGRTSAYPRIQFEPKNADQECSTWCSPISLPPPYVVVGNIYGPFLPGEEKVCEYEVQILEEFSGTIPLVGTNGGVFVTRIQPKIPTLTNIGVYVLCILTLFFGISHFRTKRHRTDDHAR